MAATTTATTTVKVPSDAHILTDRSHEARDGAHPASNSKNELSPWAARAFAAVRISVGWVFLWAFLDKTFGLGFATESSNAWIDGGSPTLGFLSFATRGPLDGFYQNFAGDLWADWLFMVGLFGIGVALMLGVGVRIAAASGAVMLIMMWTAALWPENNPFMDDHIVYAIVLVGLALSNSGDTWGLGRWWTKQQLVRRYPVLR